MTFFYKIFTFYSKEQGQSLLNFLNGYSRELDKNVKKLPKSISKVDYVNHNTKNKNDYNQEDER